MTQMESPATIVTGAGSGIGREIARPLQTEGYAPVVAERRREALEDTARS